MQLVDFDFYYYHKLSFSIIGTMLNCFYDAYWNFSHEYLLTIVNSDFSED